MTKENFEELRKDLGQFEKELPSPSVDSLISLGNGLQRIWQRLRHEDISEEVQGQIRQLRYTHVRRFLEAVSQMSPFPEEIWFHIYCYLDLVNEDLDRLLSGHPELKPGHDYLEAMYPDSEFDRRIEELKKRLLELRSQDEE